MVAPGVPHHVTQRGNRRQAVFFGEQDYATYIGLLAAGCRARAGGLEEHDRFKLKRSCSLSLCFGA